MEIPIKMDDLGGNPPIFRKHPFFRDLKKAFSKDPFFVQPGFNRK